MQNSPADDKQIGGTHYKKLDPEPWNVILQWNLGYLEGTALKYIARWRDKGGIDDIRKAIHFLEKLVEINTPSKSESNFDAVVKAQRDFLESKRNTVGFSKFATMAEQTRNSNSTSLEINNESNSTGYLRQYVCSPAAEPNYNMDRPFVMAQSEGLASGCSNSKHDGITCACKHGPLREHAVVGSNYYAYGNDLAAPVFSNTELIPKGLIGDEE